MNGKTYINGDELTALANSLKAKSEDILNSYKGDCSQAIQMSSECLQLSGLNTTEFFQALEKIYTQVNERINSFADFLTNVVVAEYNAVAEAITNSFNMEFALEISRLLGIGVASSIGPITAPTYPGTPRPLDPVHPGPINPGRPPIKRIQPGIKKPKDDRIYLDPRESEGFNKPVIKELDDSKNSKPVIELDPREKEGFNDPIINGGGIPKGPIESTNSNKGNDYIRAVEIGEGTSFTPDSSVKSTVKPDLPPLPTQPVSSGGSFSRGSTISGGGGGGMDTANIAFDSGLTNPLKLGF